MGLQFLATGGDDDVIQCYSNYTHHNTSFYEAGFIKLWNSILGLVRSQVGLRTPRNQRHTSPKRQRGAEVK